MYFRQAKDGENEWWQYLLGVLALSLGYGLGQLPLLWAQMGAVGKYQLGTAEIEAFTANMDFTILHYTRNQGLALLFTIFVVATIVFLLAVKFIHKKSIKGMITPRSKINVPKIIYGFVVWLALSFLFELVLYFTNPELYTLNVQWGKFFWLFVICITLLPIQTTLEELFFRSYLLKGIGLLATSKWIPIVITALFFGLVHGTNPEVSKYGVLPMQVYYISAGILLAVMTVMDDGLELAIGVHIATNMYGALFFCYEGSVLQTDSIWSVSEVNPWIMAGVFIASGIIFLLLSQKMFDWKSFKKILEPIDLDEPTANELSILE